MSGRFVLEIGELVVEGVAPSERGVVALALQRELQRLVAERGVPRGVVDAGDRTLLDVGNVRITPTDGAAAVGARAGQALYGALQ